VFRASAWFGLKIVALSGAYTAQSGGNCQPSRGCGKKAATSKRASRNDASAKNDGDA
jgi:hypothetical protein